MRTRFWVELGFYIAGPLIWLTHYLLSYAMNALHCARPLWSLDRQWLGWPIFAWVIVVSGVLALIAMGWIAVRQARRSAGAGRSRFHARLTRALVLLSAMAVIWQVLPVFLVPACG